MYLTTNANTYEFRRLKSENKNQKKRVGSESKQDEDVLGYAML
jgi:hypothetical protein